MSACAAWRESWAIARVPTIPASSTTRTWQGSGAQPWLRSPRSLAIVIDGIAVCSCSSRAARADSAHPTTVLV